MYEHAVNRTENHTVHPCQPGVSYGSGRQKKLFRVTAFYLSWFFSEGLLEQKLIQILFGMY